MTHINQNMIQAAVDILRSGGIVVYPTETVYGIGCDPLNSNACSRVRRLKGRSVSNHSKPFILIADSVDRIEQFAGPLDTVPRKLARVFWPGPLTMVLIPEKQLPGYLKGPSGGVAFRVTPHPVAALLSREFGMPLVSTSANMTGEEPASTFDEAVRLFGGRADIILENDDPVPGGSMAGEPSTVLDLTSPTPRFLRVGALGREEILRVL